MFTQYFFYRLKKAIAVCCLLFLTQLVNAQQKIFGQLINRIGSLSAAGLPKSAAERSG
jgi:hypothetical protein